MCVFVCVFMHVCSVLNDLRSDILTVLELEYEPSLANS